MSSMVLSSKVQDARAAMCALIESRALPYREDEPGFPAAVAALAWAIAEAMAAERIRRTRGSK